MNSSSVDFPKIRSGMALVLYPQRNTLFSLFNPRGDKQVTNRTRHIVLSALFDFIISTFDAGQQNFLRSSVLRKICKRRGPWYILEKDRVDEVVFSTTNNIHNYY